MSYVLAGRCPITGGNFSGLQGAKICRRRAAVRCLATFTEVEIDTGGLQGGEEGRSAEIGTLVWGN